MRQWMQGLLRCKARLATREPVELYRVFLWKCQKQRRLYEFFFVIGMRQVVRNNHRTRPFWYINPKKFNRFHKNFIISVVFYFLFWKYTKIQWKLMIDKKFRDCFQISRLANIPMKWFSSQNGPLDIRFQMRLTPAMGAFYFLKN